MRRADRLFEIVQLLRRARRPVAAGSIADELEVSVRTIYRDIATLIARRVPIRGEPGIGYILESGFDMPPLMLTRDELDAVVLGAHWVASRGEADLAKAAENLLAKIEAILPEALRDHILEPATSIAPVERPIEHVNAAILRRAIRSNHKMAIAYRTDQGALSERVIWPVLLGYRDSGRIMAAWCEWRGAFRYFRTDRMVSATLLDERIPERRATLRARWQAAMEEERERYRQAAEARQDMPVSA
jgi:predicted DNA-binding transcriptional regulator YafY